jgi:putative cell wall-binding protein
VAFTELLRRSGVHTSAAPRRFTLKRVALTVTAALFAVGVPLVATAAPLPPGVTVNGYGDLLNYPHTITFPVQLPVREVQYTFRAARGSTRTHEGNDIICTAKMQPLLAAAGGTISYITIPQRSWGYSLRVRADDGWTYSYLHLNNDTPGTDDGAATLDAVFGPGIALGSRVEAGQVVGYCGDSGNAENSGSHLHFEIRDDENRLVDPAPSLRAALSGTPVTVVTAPIVAPTSSTTTLPGQTTTTAPGQTPSSTTTSTTRPASTTAVVPVATLAIAGITPPPPDPATVALRLAGADRVATAVLASQSGWPLGSGEVVIVDANQFAEALPASVLAARRSAPILQVQGGWSQPVSAEIARLGARRAWVVGSVTPDVDAALGALFVEVRRVGIRGDAVGTAAQIARMVGTSDGTAVLVNPERFPDVVAAASLAAQRGWPIIYTAARNLPQPTVDAYRAIGVRSTVVVGGSQVVADNVVRFVPGGRRVSGADRYATSAAVANEAFRTGTTTNRILLVSGTNFPDAVSSGALSARLGASTVLLDGAATGTDASTMMLLMALRGRSIPHVLGGPVAISPAAEQNARVLLGFA